ncbi:MAG: GNAT family protein [Bacilli bacterium]|nr:GNAT family protein [Bacilli bacterium]
MKKLELIEPELNEYGYEKKLLEDPITMHYNAGYEVSYDGYNYETGCILFPEIRWERDYIRRKNSNRFFSYIKDISINKYVGYVNYQYNEAEQKYECGIVIEGEHRGKGYAREALKLLCSAAFQNGVHTLYDNFEKDRGNTLQLFQSIGFKVEKEMQWKKFDQMVDGVIVSLKKEDFISDKCTSKLSI